jgi:uncharacterized protein (DUF4415 family)
LTALAGEAQMPKARHNAATRPDDENPEWTAEDFRKARPALEVLKEVFGEKAANAVRRRHGVPAKPDQKIGQSS